mmetsp:Transcript_54049/g.105739  ORF Transcript_54049/g.105739 Transcript_54049/m.105739 type:complete len:347 (+) Transcript_54049:833-1873(+)
MRRRKERFTKDSERSLFPGEQTSPSWSPAGRGVGTAVGAGAPCCCCCCNCCCLRSDFILLAAGTLLIPGAVGGAGGERESRDDAVDMSASKLSSSNSPWCTATAPESGLEGFPGVVYTKPMETSSSGSVSSAIFFSFSALFCLLETELSPFSFFTLSLTSTGEAAVSADPVSLSFASTPSFFFFDTPQHSIFAKVSPMQVKGFALFRLFCCVSVFSFSEVGEAGREEVRGTATSTLVVVCVRRTAGVGSRSLLPLLDCIDCEDDTPLSSSLSLFRDDFPPSSAAAMLFDLFLLIRFLESLKDWLELERSPLSSSERRREERREEEERPPEGVASSQGLKASEFLSR